MLGIFVLLLSAAQASLVPSGYTVPDLVVNGIIPDVPLLVEPATIPEYQTTPCTKPTVMCPRIAHVPILRLDQRDVGPAKLRDISSDQLSQEQKDAGAKNAFYIYDYSPQVMNHSKSMNITCNISHMNQAISLSLDNTADPSKIYTMHADVLILDC